MLKQTLQDTLITALKEKNTQKVSTLRFLQSAIKNKEIEKKTELSDDEIVQIIRKQVKELTDAKEMFEKGGRTDLVSANEEQITILQTYLPIEITDDELKKEIERIIEQNTQQYQKNPKSIIGICISALRGKASPQRIMNILNEHLEKRVL